MGTVALGILASISEQDSSVDEEYCAGFKFCTRATFECSSILLDVGHREWKHRHLIPGPISAVKGARRKGRKYESKCVTLLAHSESVCRSRKKRPAVWAASFTGDCIWHYHMY